MNVHWKKSTSESKGKPEQKSDASFGTIFRINKCFQEAGKNFLLIFLLNYAGQKFYNHLRMYRSTD
jgi:hypothetical protein